MTRSDVHAAPLGRAPGVPRHVSALPDDAVAVIEPCGPGRRRADGPWRLRFRRDGSGASAAPAWLASDDPLTHLSLRFDTREAAIRYAERHGLAWEVRDAAPRRLRAMARVRQDRPQSLCCWPTGPHALCCGDYPALRQGPRRAGEQGKA